MTTPDDDFDLSQFLDMNSLVKINEGQPSPAGSIPFMITQTQKVRLRELGHSDEAIAMMAPESAHRILEESKS
jgi:hypothetical protein